MPYQFLDLDLDHPVTPVRLEPDEDGLAVLVRRAGRPLAFWMDPHPPGTVVSREELRARAAAEAGEAIVRAEAVRELGATGATGPLPSLTVAVCTRDRPDRLARCLRSLDALRLSVGAIPPDILVVDNAPPDNRTQAVATDAGVRYVREPLAGLNFARNRALAEARGGWLAFLDDDVVVDPSWLAGFYEALAVHPDAGAVTGLILPYALETEAQVLFEQAGGFRRGFQPLRYQGSTRPGDANYPVGAGIFGAGANMAFRREVLLDLGGFDEALDTGPPLPGGGDLDAFYRVVRSGAPLVYWPSVLVFHEHRRDLDALRRQYHSWGMGLMAFLDKTYRTDPSQRPKVRGILRWWFRYQGSRLKGGLQGRGTLPTSMVTAEVRGGLRGIAGEYKRSQKRIETIRRAHQPVGE